MPPRHPTIARALGLVREAMPQPPPTAVLAACSGGPDSVALCGLLSLVAGADGFDLVLGHVDHGLRPESADEAEAVRALATALGHSILVDRLELEAGPSLPARARAQRRATLVRQARTAGAAVIALGHTATDQAETMLMHLSRGAGLEGLAAMRRIERWVPDETNPASPGGVWWRPLLGLRRPQTRELAQRLELPFTEDPTNLDPSQPRIAIRREVLPVLCRLRPHADLAFAAAARVAADADEALAVWTETELGARGHDDGSLDVENIGALPRAVRTRLIRHVCIAAGAGPEALSRGLVEQIDVALCRPHGGPLHWDLHPRKTLRLARGRLWVDPTPDAG